MLCEFDGCLSQKCFFHYYIENIIEIYEIISSSSFPASPFLVFPLTLLKRMSHNSSALVAPSLFSMSSFSLWIFSFFPSIFLTSSPPSISEPLLYFFVSSALLFNLIDGLTENTDHKTKFSLPNIRHPSPDLFPLNFSIFVSRNSYRFFFCGTSQLSSLS